VGAGSAIASACSSSWSAARSTLRRVLQRFAGPRGWRRAAWMIATALAAVVLAGGALLAGRTATAWAQLRGGQAQLVVYLAQDTEPAQRQALAEELAALGGVTRVETVAPDEALRRLRTALAADQALLDGVEPETMPASIEASLEPGLENVLPMSPTFAALRRHPAVEDVVIEPALPDSLGSAMTLVAPWARSLTFLFAGLAALCAFAVARLAWALPRQELAVARLLGAGPAFHLAPMAISAALAAGLGALLGVAALLAGSAQVSSSLAPLAATSPSISSAASSAGLLGFAEAALLVVAAALIAGAGAARAALAPELADD
jgi:cell division transport system permease protein